MNRSFSRLACSVCVVSALQVPANADLVVMASHDGYLTWTNIDPSLYYSIQWKPSVTGSNDWSESYRILQDLQSSNEVIRIPVPVLFRVVGRSDQVHTLGLTPEVAAFPAGYYDAFNLLDVDTDLSASNIVKGTELFGVEGSLVPSAGTATPADVISSKTFYGAGQSNWVLQVGTYGGSMAAPPEVVDNIKLYVEEGGTGRISDANLWILDPDTPAGGITVEVIEVVQYGYLLVDGMAVVPGTTFTQSDIDSGIISYVHDGSDCPTADFFVFSVSDGATTLEDMVFQIETLAVDDSPSIIYNDPLVVDAACGVRRVSAGELGAVDADTPDIGLHYELISTHSHGELRLAGTPLIVGSTFTQADVNRGRLSYQIYGGQHSSDVAGLLLSDGGSSDLPLSLQVTITGIAADMSATVDE